MYTGACPYISIESLWDFYDRWTCNKRNKAHSIMKSCLSCVKKQGRAGYIWLPMCYYKVSGNSTGKIFPFSDRLSEKSAGEGKDAKKVLKYVKRL